MQGNQALTNPQAQAQSKPFTTLPDLLPTSTTIPVVESLPPKSIDSLLSYLPPTLLLLSQEADDISSVDLKPETAAAALEALSLDQKKDILKKVLRSPQFSQSLGSLTQALRDGGLPSISDALGVKVKNGGFTRRGGMPVGDGEAVEAFLRGVRGSVEEKEQEDQGENMQTN
jgi:26S proteasome regulatory subunit N13